MQKRKTKALKITGVIVAVFILIIAGGLFAITRGLDEMQDLVINNINIGDLPDGEYTGEFDSYRWSNKVTVTIVDGKITEVRPENGQALELELSERIIASQSLQVDIDTGATVSSKAFLKAVEEALSY